ncbi:hypothetical protein [Virgibacillus doumboii]|uniref:hypothetical protein n=1 Tax=Virgibacillus doumboii TaxID=2697503 RepID=UPI0013DF33C6|nr:hypothetical protein [Virgibacillus doumboii]
MNKKTIHIVNISLGVLVIGVCLFMAWFGLALVPIIDTTTGIIIPIIILLIWLSAYYLQVRSRSSKTFAASLSVEVVVLFIIVLQLSQQVSITISG